MYRFFLLLGFFLFLNFEKDRAAACDDSMQCTQEECSFMKQVNMKVLTQKLLAISKNPSDVLKFLEEAPQNIRNLTSSLRNKEEALAEQTALNKKEGIEKKSLKVKLEEAMKRISELTDDKNYWRSSYKKATREGSGRDEDDDATEVASESDAGAYFGENESAPSNWGED